MSLLGTIFTKPDAAPEPDRPEPVDVLDSLRESIIIVSENLRIYAVNEPARIAFTRREESLINKRITEVIRDFALHEAFDRAFNTGKTSVVRVELIDQDRKVYEVRVAPFDMGDARRAIGVFYDITQIEHLERVRQVFLSNISHELRTPLTSILAFVETLEDGAIDDEANKRRFLSVIRKNAERMRHLIDDISELSSIEAGNVKIEPKLIDLAGLVREVFASLSAKAEERDIFLENAIEPGTKVFADILRLEQMLTNLIDNGIKFNSAEGTVTVRCLDKPESHVIEVSDTGEGIMREHVQRIFERFYRIDRARTREVGGTGLGLAIVKHLARLHNGEVTVSSVLGEGSSFRVELPKTFD
ncbi:MAG: PAS domain-containing protein [Acidobacteria bacterium]|nr:MAG: PAS domain-containing protein [Acidobacteriota bacterium]REJ99182.1 MAG: PAS domain-containing protein [Acidobacteriota bacterium]REK16097.1 MAG: PAS domain-containing protein [Acidobacteriota bacterium]REK43778.1 MAG: PAS domain-containing protein [Acidobacteriota bacterium]